MTAAAKPNIVGYVSCSRCGDPWVLKIVASRTGGLCPDKCWIEMRGSTTIKIGRAEVKRTGLRKHKPKVMTERRRERIKARDKARLAALRRLADIYPLEFSELLAEERAARGLDPWTVDAALQSQLREAS